MVFMNLNLDYLKQYILTRPTWFQKPGRSSRYFRKASILTLLERFLFLLFINGFQ
ncbi:hypothetical protein SAMN06295967_104136 [Belliella buryatensis]|uniref:Uncharacterized protein n=1 Tax=Belliella buryatensis TaxID=1500549 RepID=A0A239C9P9_9BACT|nr:hypothetical protein SAMN06295967_104136 [Belliella buryatensis]